MLIDFHAHVFPDAIAERAVMGIVNASRDIYGMERYVGSDATVSTLKKDMERNNVDISVTMPIATKPGQYKSINRFAAEITDGKIISFASLHPFDVGVDDILDDIKKSGFKGIKLHPDYQGVYVDDDVMINLVKKASERGLYTLLHTGEDLGIKKPFKCALPNLRRFLNVTDNSLLILAHMGGFNIWDGVEKYLLDSKAYFDTAVVSKFIDKDTYRRIIERHGAEKILFGTDTPWENPKDTLAFLESSGISAEETEYIKHRNAERILKLE